MNSVANRRTALQTFGVAIAAGAASAFSTAAGGAPTSSDHLLPSGASGLIELTTRLAAAPRKRDFKTVPAILNHQDQWDHQALSEVLAYKPPHKQVWDNTDIAGPWLNVMRNSLNTQIWSFDHPDFLVVSGNHGTAQIALYDQDIWEKYDLAKLAGAGVDKNSLLIERPAAYADPANYEDPTGVFSGENNSIPALQRRGAVFMACHNAIWEHAIKLHNSGVNPDKATVDVIAAELSNHLIPGVVLTPGAVGTIAELQLAGFQYAR
jgi:intracellular sulfur oxidation DsrE/DsrF family protein